MNNYYRFLTAIISFSSLAHAMEHSAKNLAERPPKIIENLSTKIFLSETKKEYELYSLLLYRDKAPDNFQKSYILNITYPEGDKDEYTMPKTEVIKQGRLDSLNMENLNNIVNGYCTYHYGYKSSCKIGDQMDIGAFVINPNMHWSKKQKVNSLVTWERNEIYQAAVARKITKKKNKESLNSVTNS